MLGVGEIVQEEGGSLFLEKVPRWSAFVAARKAAKQKTNGESGKVKGTFVHGENSADLQQS